MVRNEHSYRYVVRSCVGNKKPKSNTIFEILFTRRPTSRARAGLQEVVETPRRVPFEIVMADSQQLSAEPALIPKAPVKLQIDKSSISKVAGVRTDEIIKAISETIFVYDQKPTHEYTPIKIEVDEEVNIENKDLVCNLTLVSETNKDTILQVNAKCKLQDEDGVVEFYEVKEVKTDFESEDTWFFNLCKQFELLGPWIDFPKELVGELEPVREAKPEADAAESEPSSESEK